jgi:hypothetical protein
MQTGGFFLLDPQNEPFAAGTSHKLPSRGHGCVLIFMSIFVVAGLLIAGDLTRRWAYVVLLNTEYAETQGQVTGHRIEFDEGATYYVAYRYVAGDRAYLLEDAVTKDTYHSLDDGQAVLVRYARRNATIATIEPGRYGGLLLLTGFCLVWNGFVFGISWLLAREYLKRSRLARQGRLIAGEIAACTSHRDGDGDLVVDLDYRFRSPLTWSWTKGTGSQLRKDMERKPLPAPGTPVHVLYVDDETHMVL